MLILNVTLRRAGRTIGNVQYIVRPSGFNPRTNVRRSYH